VLAMLAKEGTQEPDVAALEKKVLDYRRSMRQGHMVLKQTWFKKDVHDPRLDCVTTIWFDGKKLRNDKLFRYSGEPENAPLHTEKECRNCEKDGFWLYYNDYKGFPEGELGVSMTNMATSKKPEAFDLVHPQRLGMVPDSVANLATSRAQLESFVSRSDRRNVSLRRVQWRDLESFQITYQLPSTPGYGANACVRIWILPDRGPSVLRIEGEWDVQDNHYFDSVESDLRQIIPSGLWYPQTVTYERRINGESLDKEVTDVQEVSLNEPISAEVFTLAGLNLPVNKPVFVLDKKRSDDNSKNGFQYWNGEKLIPKSDLRFFSPSGLTTKRFFIANSVFFALLAVGLFLRWVLRKRTS
jgi:hypothetical protein